MTWVAAEAAAERLYGLDWLGPAAHNTADGNAHNQVVKS